MPNRLVKITQRARKSSELYEAGSASVTEFTPFKETEFWAQFPERAPFMIVFVDAKQVCWKCGEYLPDGSALLDEEADLSAVEQLCEFQAKNTGRLVESDFVDSSADCHTIVPNLFASTIAIERLITGVGGTNPEFFVRRWLEPEPTCRALYPFHKAFGGKTNLRWHCLADGSQTTAFDLHVGTENLDEILIQYGNVLCQLGITVATLHNGKYQVDGLGPITLVPYYEFWPNTPPEIRLPAQDQCIPWPLCK
jgi:hypothetical protein